MYDTHHSDNDVQISTAAAAWPDHITILEDTPAGDATQPVRNKEATHTGESNYSDPETDSGMRVRLSNGHATNHTTNKMHYPDSVWEDEDLADVVER